MMPARSSGRMAISPVESQFARTVFRSAFSIAIAGATKIKSTPAEPGRANPSRTSARRVTRPARSSMSRMEKSRSGPADLVPPKRKRQRHPWQETRPPCLPLSLRLAFLSKLKTLTGDSEWCFPNNLDDGHVDVKVVSKQVGDRQARFKNRKTLCLRAATGPNRKSSDNANPNLLRSMARSDSRCSTVTTRSPRLALI